MSAVLIDVEPPEPNRLGEVLWLEPYPDAVMAARRARANREVRIGSISRNRFNVLIQSNPRYRRSSFRIELWRLISESRSGSESEPGMQIWRAIDA